MAKRNCTDTRHCNLMTCYACRRRQIDVTIETMIEMGMSKDAVDQYRSSAINNLAWEIIPPAPEAPKPRKAVPAVDADLVRDTITALRACHNVEIARQMLSALRVLELRAVAKALDLGSCSGKLKGELVNHLISFTVQARLDHAAIMRAFNH